MDLINIKSNLILIYLKITENRREGLKIEIGINYDIFIVIVI